MYGYITEQFEIVGDIMENYKDWEAFETDLEERNPWA